MVFNFYLKNKDFFIHKDAAEFTEAAQNLQILPLKPRRLDVFNLKPSKQRPTVF
jgi:hypothetical protein